MCVLLVHVLLTVEALRLVPLQFIGFFFLLAILIDDDEHLSIKFAFNSNTAKPKKLNFRFWIQGLRWE